VVGAVPACEVTYGMAAGIRTTVFDIFEPRHNSSVIQISAQSSMKYLLHLYSSLRF